jgi:hypothetical protein
MRQSFLILGLSCAIFLMTSAFDQRVLTDTPAVSTFIPQSAEAPGGPLLDKLISAVAPERVQWLQMTVLQKMFEDNCQSEGRFILGPGQRRRLEMKVRVNSVAGSNVFTVSDGQNICQARWTEGKQPRLKKIALPDSDIAGRDRYLLEHGLGGLLPLLTQIREHLHEPIQQAGLCQQRKAIRLSGAWKTDEDRPKNLPAHLRPSQCAVYLDAESFWPFRIEWIGCPRPGDRPVLLMQMDFRDPVINQPPSDAECASLFEFPFDCSPQALAAEEKLRVAEEASYEGK